jgi:hypothetical protein
LLPIALAVRFKFPWSRPSAPQSPLEAWRRLVEDYPSSTAESIEAAVTWDRDHELEFLTENAQHFADPVSVDPTDLAMTHEFMRRRGAYLLSKSTHK